MAKVEQVLQRVDGSEVKIVADACTGIGLTSSIWVHVHRREAPGHAWELMGDRPHPDWRKMSVDEYIKHGRPEMLQVAAMGEILKVTNALHANFGR
jgi:hypothetical protein